MVGRPSAQIRFAESDERIVVTGAGLAVAFTRAVDRWTHRLATTGDEPLEFAQAVESDAERDEPARVVSPVYQEIHRHEHPEEPGCCVLFTGRLHQHHFSAAFTLRRHDDEPCSAVADFDIADRCRAPVLSLAATYLVLCPIGAITAADPSIIAWGLDGRHEGRLELAVDPPATLALAEAGRHATRVQALAATSPGGFTHRLHYRWRWTSAAGWTR